MGKVRVYLGVTLAMIMLALGSCGGQGHSVMLASDSDAAGGNGAFIQPETGTITPALGAEGSSEPLIPPAPTSDLPLPPALQTQSVGGGGISAPEVSLGGFSLGELPETIPPKPANWEAIKSQIEARRSSSAKSASDATLYSLTPFDPQTLSARGPFVKPHGGVNGVLDCFEYLSSDNPTTPLLETFNAQHLSAGNTELHVWGTVNSSDVRDMIYAQIGLVTDYTYSFALDPNQDGDPGDAVPPYLFNQNVAMMNAISGGTPFVAPLDFNGSGGLGFARGYAPGNAFDFDLRLVPNQLPGGSGGLCWLRVRPRSVPYQPWSVYSGLPGNPAQGYAYGKDNWGWRPPEDFSAALLLAQIYSYNPTNVTGSITFQYVQATEGPLDVPTVDCRSLLDARFLLASPGADGLQGTGDDTALTGWSSTNAAINAEPALLLGDRFYVMFDNDPAQTNDIELYPAIPVAGMVRYTTRGLLADPALAAYFELPDAVPGWPGLCYSAMHPYTLLLRNGAYNRIENDVRSLGWANFQVATNPGFTAITSPRPTNGSHEDRMVLAQGTQYTPFFYNLAYSLAGSYPPPAGFGAVETIYPSAHTSGFIRVGYNSLSEGGSVLGNYYNQTALVNTLQADAYCRFETRANWGAIPTSGMVDANLLGWITLPLLDPRSQPWNTAVYARGTSFFLQTTDGSYSPTVAVVAGQQLDAGLGPVSEVVFNLAGGPPPPPVPPPPSSFNVLPVRVYDDPAQTDPDANVAQVGDGWDVAFNFLLQYGATAGNPPVPRYTVELDGDWGGAWNDGTPGRTYPLPGSPFGAPGPQSSVMHISSLMLPNGTYTFAIRVTDTAGDQYIYVWPTPIVLGGVAPQRPEWWMFGHDAQHSRRSRIIGAQNNHVKWSFATGGALYSSPSIAGDGTVYVGSGLEHELYALNPDGSYKWSFTTGGVVQSSPAIAEDGTIYVGSDDNYLYAVRPTGTMLWRRLTGRAVGSSPVIGPDGTVYVGSEDSTLYAVNPDGSLQWTYPVGSGIHSSPALGPDGTIYFGSFDNRLYALNPDGSLKWAYATGGAVVSSPAVGVDGTVYVGSEDNSFYAFNPDGSVKWTYAAGGNVDSSPAIARDGTIYVGSDDFNLYAFRPDGTVKWSYATTGFVYSSPAIGADGTVYVGSVDYKFYALDQNGILKWSYTAGDAVNTSPAIGGDGTVYVGSYSGVLYAFGPDSFAGPGDWWMFGHDRQHTHRSPFVGAQTNDVAWSFDTGSAIWHSSAVTGADGAVYVASHFNTLYAINRDGSLRWSYVPGILINGLSPAIAADGTIYAGSDDAKIYAINPDGSLKWTYLTGGSIYVSSPAIGTDGTVYVGCTDNQLYAINPDGSLKWTYTTGDQVDSSPAIGLDGTVYVGSVDHKLYAINPDGSLRWSYTTGERVHSSPAIGADGTVYVGSYDGKLYAINPDGSLQWTYTTTAGVSIDSSPAIAADGTVYVGSCDFSVYAINPDGTLKWTYPTGDLVVSSPAVGADGTVYVGSLDNIIYALSANGTLKWSYTMPDLVNSSPAIGADGTVYVGSWDGKLYAFGSGGGPSGWVVSNPNPDNAGDCGQFNSLAMVAGLPAIAYYDATDAQLKYVRALDANGSAWLAPVVVGSGDGWYASLMVINGNPAIAYYDHFNGSLMFIRALDPLGTVWGAPVAVDAPGNAWWYVSLAVINGNPAIAYYDFTGGGLKYARASDASGTAWNPPLLIDASVDRGAYASLTEVNGRPAVSYYAAATNSLLYLRADDTDGANWTSAPVSIDTGGGIVCGTWTSLEVINGNPAITYRRDSPGQVRYVRALDADGAGWNAPLVIDSTSDAGAAGTALCVIGGNPAVAYYRGFGKNTCYSRAIDADGTAWGVPEAADTLFDVGRYLSLAEVNGQPGISYYDATSGNLKFARYYP